MDMSSGEYCYELDMEIGRGYYLISSGYDLGQLENNARYYQADQDMYLDIPLKPRHAKKLRAIYEDFCTAIVEEERYSQTTFADWVREMERETQ
jgi:hypothetical protein